MAKGIADLVESIAANTIRRRDFCPGSASPALVVQCRAYFLRSKPFVLIVVVQAVGVPNFVVSDASGPRAQQF